MNTLFSRRSTLKAWGEPTATVATGSAPSITVRWFIAVCTRTTRSRDGVSVSIFCTGSGGNVIVSARVPIRRRLIFLISCAFVQLAQRALFRAAPGAYLLLYSRSLKRPGFPRANRRMFEERLLLGIGVELPDARWIAVHEYRKTRTEGFFAGCQKLAPLLATAQNSGLAGANSGVLRQIRERHHAIPDLPRSFLDGERLYRIHAHAVENDVSVLRDLEQENTRSEEHTSELQ